MSSLLDKSLGLDILQQFCNIRRIRHNPTSGGGLGSLRIAGSWSGSIAFEWQVYEAQEVAPAE